MSTRFYAGQIDYIEQLNSLDDALANVTQYFGVLNSTSITANDISIGTKNFLVEAGKQYTAGMSIKIVDANNSANFLFGTVLAYLNGSLDVDITYTEGVGTGLTSWVVMLSGIRGPQGTAGSMTGPGSSIIGNLVLFANTAGSLTSDSGIAYTSLLISSGSYANPVWLTSLDKTKVGLSNVENTTLSTWIGTTNITTLGSATATNLLVSGSSTFSANITTIGNSTNDLKDRGFTFNWNNGSLAKLGFFGFDTSTGYLTYIPDMTYDSPEVVQGTVGTISANITGNSGTVTNGVYSTGSYSNPVWLTSLSKDKVGLGNVENTALSTWTGSTNLTTLGAATAISINSSGNFVGLGPTNTIDASANGAVQWIVRNAYSGTNASSSLIVGNDSLTKYGQFRYQSAAYTTSGMAIADSVTIRTSGLTQGINIGTMDAANIKFWGNNTLIFSLYYSGNAELGTKFRWTPSSSYYRIGTVSVDPVTDTFPHLMFAGGGTISTMNTQTRWGANLYYATGWKYASAANGSILLQDNKVLTYYASTDATPTRNGAAGLDTYFEVNPTTGTNYLKATAGAGVRLRFFNNGQTTNQFQIGQGLSSASDNIGYVWNIANADLSFGTNNTERLRLTASGNLECRRVYSGSGTSVGDSEFVLYNYASKTPAWQMSVRQDIGGANNDWKLLRFKSSGSYQGIAMQVQATTGNIQVLKDVPVMRDWHANSKALQIANRSAIWEYNTTDLHLTCNGYFDGGTWRVVDAGYASSINTSGNGWVFYQMYAATPGAAISSGVAVASISNAGVLNAANFVSGAAIGTQPYACTSTTLNTNLNADLLDGRHRVVDIGAFENNWDPANSGPVSVYNDATGGPAGSFFAGLQANLVLDTRFGFQIGNFAHGEGTGLWYRHARPDYGATSWDGNWYKIWSSQNDGTGSGLDADTLDGSHASAFLATGSLTNVAMASIVTTSGTSKDITGIPSNCTEITITFEQVSWAAGTTIVPRILLGDSGGFETTGYQGYVSYIGGTTGSMGTAGFTFSNSIANTDLFTGVLKLYKGSSSTNTWCVNATFTTYSSGVHFFMTGIKSLSDVLTQVRITSLNASTFDGGAITVTYS